MPILLNVPCEAQRIEAYRIGSAGKICSSTIGYRVENGVHTIETGRDCHSKSLEHLSIALQQGVMMDAPHDRKVVLRGHMRIETAYTREFAASEIQQIALRIWQ